jgi:hypothetical protein
MKVVMKTVSITVWENDGIRMTGIIGGKVRSKCTGQHEGRHVCLRFRCSLGLLVICSMYFSVGEALIVKRTLTFCRGDVRKANLRDHSQKNGYFKEKMGSISGAQDKHV